MINPTDEELAAAVAKVIEVKHSPPTSSFPWRGELYGEPTQWPSKIHLAWNAIMAAVAKLEDNDFGEPTFEREPGTWEVFYHELKDGHHREHFENNNTASEARALALCIHAVVGND